MKMQPGKPVVFGRLPVTSEFPAQFFLWSAGNPVSTQVTFHCLWSRCCARWVEAGRRGHVLCRLRWQRMLRGKAGLLRVLPARLTTDRVRPEVRLVGWQGSGDLAANARANCYAVLPPEKERFGVGDVITVLLR